MNRLIFSLLAIGGLVLATSAHAESARTNQLIIKYRDTPAVNTASAPASAKLLQQSRLQSIAQHLHVRVRLLRD